MITLKRLLIALVAFTASGLLVVGLGIANAETPAERCKRETTAYNNAWKNTWAQANPGKSPSDAPPPPVPYKCGGGNDGPPPTLSPTPDDEPDDTTPTTNAPTTTQQRTGPNVNAPTERRELENVDRGQEPIGGNKTTSLTPSEAPRETESESASSPTKPKNRKTKAPTSSDRPTRGNPTEPFKKNASNDGNNDTSDSACVRIWGTETRIGSNCHHYREEVRKISGNIRTDFGDVAGQCSYGDDSLPCELGHDIKRAITIGFTGGFSSEFVKMELSMAKTDESTIKITCGKPKDPDRMKATIAYVSYYEPHYTIDRYYVSGGGLAERSAEQVGKEGRGVHCEHIPRTV